MSQFSWYTKDIKDVYRVLDTNSNGLSEESVLIHREKYGSNILESKRKVTTFEVFLSQFKSVFIYVLFLSAILLAFLGEYLDGLIILFVIFINATIGTVQEGKARDTLDALQHVVKSYATVLRDGKPTVVQGDEVVVGDILILKDGDIITADARLIEVNRLKVSQSVLTGESEPIIKDPTVLVNSGLQTSDQDNMVFKGTYVISGYATAIVTAVGLDTTIGGVATALDDLKTEMPLEKNIKNLSKVIMFIILAIVVILFISGIMQGMSIATLALTVVAVAVSAIPESLPVVVTLVLAAGVFRMSKKNVLVRRLQAVESLGQADILALDKTGTITHNQMVVEKVFIDGQIFEVTGDGYEPSGQVFDKNQNIINTDMKSLDVLGKIAAFTAVANVAYDSETKDWKVISGDPTEVALKVFAEKIGLKKSELETNYKQVFEIPFDFQTKYHAVIHDVDNNPMMFVAGSPEVLLNWSSKIYKNGKNLKFTKEDFKHISSIVTDLSNQGFRVLAGCVDFSPNKHFEKIDTNNLKDLSFIGLFAIKDSVRSQVYDAIKNVYKAGMRAVMITGDHKETAESIARDIGLFKDGDKIMTGYEIDDLSDDGLKNAVGDVSVFARVSPSHKLRIIQAYKDRKEVIAMTGDGINDALSLTAADLGVAMGKSGTEVAREASDIILLDDNFDNITQAVIEGRNIYATIRKTVLYLLSTNIGEVLVISIAVLFGLPLPLLATQIIWLNMVTDTFLVAALALEPRDSGLMNRRFGKPSKYIVDWPMALRIILISSVMTLGTLWLFTEFLHLGFEKAWTISLTTLTAFQWWNIFNIRSDHKSVFTFSLRSNKWLIYSLFLVVVLHMFAIYTPFMQKILHTTGLNMNEWLIILAVSLSVIVVEEVRKVITRLAFNKA